jgi:hypothetical protein
MPQAIINLMYLCTQEIFLPLFPRWCLKFCQKILHFDSRIDLADFPPILSCSVAGKPNITGLTASSASYVEGINKVKGSGQTALSKMSAFDVTLNINGSGADQVIGGASNDLIRGGRSSVFVLGGDGDDIIIGGGANDDMWRIAA